MSVNRVNSSDGSLSPIATRGQFLQYLVLPTPNASIEGKILQYTGNTTGEYVNGYWYKCINDGGTYRWDNINTGITEWIDA